MKINYILSFPTSLIYHIFAQINLKNEWGDASIYSLDYIKRIEKQNKNLIISKTETEEVKKELTIFFTLITFSALRPWYVDYEKLKEDFLNDEFIKKRIEFYPNLSFEETKKAFSFLLNLLEKNKKEYLIFWESNQNQFKKIVNNFEKEHSKMFLNYYKFLHEKVNNEIPLKENYYIFMIPSLFPYGRGLEGGCAIGIPADNEQKNKAIRVSLHELTHSFSDHSLANKLKIIIEDRKDEMKNHQIKEQFVDYILQQYLRKNYPVLARKKILNYPLLAEEIKRSLDVNSHV